MAKIKYFIKDITVKDIAAVLVLILGLIWLRCFIQQNSYYEWDSTCLSMIGIGWTAFLTVLFFFLLFDDPIELRDSTKDCIVWTAISGVVFLLALLLEVGTDYFSIYGEKELILLGLEISKKYAFDIWTIVWFPYNISVLFKAMRWERFNHMAVMRGSIVIAGLSLEGILLFRPMSNVWLVDLMVLNVLTLLFAVWKYAFSETYIRKWNAAAGVLLYAVMRMVLLPLQCNRWGNGLSYLMAGDSWIEYKSMIHDITTHASFWGTSDYLRNASEVHEWLLGSNKAVMHLLYYGGWVAVIGLIAVLIGLVILQLKLINIKNGRFQRYWLIYATAGVVFIDKAVMGMLYSFGVPYPITLPFQGNGKMDTVALTFVLIGALKAIWSQRDQNLRETFVSAEEILGKKESYQIVDEIGELYIVEDYLDDVKITGTDYEISCEADWYYVEGRAFGVFKTKNIIFEAQRFILEFSENTWTALKEQDKELSERVIGEYCVQNGPDCPEEEVSYTDEESEDEDDEDL